MGLQSVPKAVALFAFILSVFACSVRVYSEERNRFVSEEANISAELLSGWDLVQGVQDNTVLKLARAGQGDQKARISVRLDDIAAGQIPAGYDMWSSSDDMIRQAARGGAVMGERITVLDVGRAAVDGVHVIWHKTRRSTPDGRAVWAFVYEGINGSQYFTSRLTSVGDEQWFSENQLAYAGFIRDLKLKASDAKTMGADPASIPAPATTMPNFVTYTNPTHGFTIQFPAGWEQNDGFGPTTVRNAYTFDANANKLVITIASEPTMPFSGAESAERWVQYIEEYQGAEVTLLKQGTAKVAGVDVPWLTTKSAFADVITMYTLHYFFSQGGKLLWVTGTTGELKSLDKHLPLYRRTIETFRWVDGRGR